jgi:hypothetical protein
MRSTMKRTLTSSDITACPPLQPAQSCITFIAPGTPTPLNCASQSSCFLSVNGTLYAGKLDGKCDEAQNDLIRHHGMSPVTTRPELCHVLSQLRHCFEAIFQLNRAAFYACTGPSMPPNSMGSAMKCTLASSDITAYPPLQPAQSSITFIAHGSPHAAALRRHVSSI